MIKLLGSLGDLPLFRVCKLERCSGYAVRQEREKAAAAAAAAAKEAAQRLADALEAAEADKVAALAALREEEQNKYLGAHAVPAVEAVARGTPSEERAESVRILAYLLAPGWLLAGKAAALEVCCMPLSTF